MSDPIYSDDRELRRVYLEGAYDEVRRLLHSPRFNRPQIEILENDAAKWRVELEALGVVFVQEKP